MAARGRHRGAKTALIGVALLLALSSAAAAEVTPADVQASLRALGFLSGLQNRSAITVAVVYHDADSKAQAQRVAVLLSRQGGPGSATVTAILLSVPELAAAPRVDALYLLPLPPDSGRAVSEFVKRQNVVSISADPACLEAQICVLFVQARSNMTIVLDTALAQAAGAKFSSVFTMLVKRK